MAHGSPHHLLSVRALFNSLSAASSHPVLDSRSEEKRTANPASFATVISFSVDGSSSSGSGSGSGSASLATVEASVVSKISSLFTPYERSLRCTVVIDGDADEVVLASETRDERLQEISSAVKAAFKTRTVVFVADSTLRAYLDRFPFMRAVQPGKLPALPFCIFGLPDDEGWCAPADGEKDEDEGMLFLGCVEQASDPHNFGREGKGLGISRVVNCTADLPNFFCAKQESEGGKDSLLGYRYRSVDTTADISYHRLAIEDQNAVALFPGLEEALLFIEAALQERRRVLVHCAQGISRSVSTVLAYLITRKDCRLRLRSTEVGSSDSADGGSGSSSSAAASAVPFRAPSPKAKLKFQDCELVGPSPFFSALQGYSQHGVPPRPNQGFTAQLLALSEERARPAEILMETGKKEE